MVVNVTPAPDSLRRVNTLQRFEAAVLFGLNLLAFARIWPHHWGLFALLFFVPDLSLLGYLGTALGRRQAGDLYNAFHSYVVPGVLLIAAWLLSWRVAGEVAMIWTTHISFDRMVGYGLKLQDGFHYTHLGTVGGKHAPAGA